MTDECACDVVLDRTELDAVLLDLDGVLTDTASLHEEAWRETFDAFLSRRAALNGQALRPFTHSDYREHVDGRPRRDGIRAFLSSRAITVPEGSDGDPPTAATIAGIARSKNDAFHTAIRRNGVRMLPGAHDLLQRLRASRFSIAVVTASRNAPAVIEAAGLAASYDVLIDGNVTAALGLRGKPAADTMLEASRRLDVPPWRAAVLEDAAAGIVAARSGGFALAVGVSKPGGAKRLCAVGADRVVRGADAILLAGQPPEASPLPRPPTTRSAIARLIGHRPIGLFLDYDGTLTPIVDRPEDAKLSDNARTALEQLARRLPVCVVSGRERGELAALVRADGVIYVGAHGFDIRGASLEPPKIHGAEELRHEFGSAARELRDRLAGIRGALVEDKRFAVAVHYRLVDEAERHLVEAAAKEVIGLHPSLRRTDGKMVIELRPRIDWDKGKAVLWLSEAVGLDRRTALPICVGDDTTDEDAFAAVRNHGLGIVVAEKPRPTAAHYRLPDTGSVIRFLQTLATAIEARDG